MAEKVLQTKIALLYKTYAQWDAIKTTYVPLKGEVCFCEVPAGASVSSTEPCVLFKVGDGTKNFATLPWASALAADVFAWAKKENLAWSDMTEEFKQGIKDLVGGTEENTLYQIVSAGTNKWQLQKSDDKGVTWVDATGTIDISATIATLEASIANKPDKEIVSAKGTAMLWNEASGGGAKFIQTEAEGGVESFVGVNDGTNGLVAQIYADKLVDGKWQGAKLDVSNEGIYYTVGNKSASQRMVADNELVVKKDIKDIEGGMHFIGAIVPEAGESLEQTIARLYATKGKSYADRKPGDIVIIRTPGDDREYICDSDKQWVELGSQGIYATKAELAAEEEAREDADATLEVAITAEETRAKAEEAKKVDKEITSAEGKALVFNEADGGGAKFENSNGINSFVGVNNGASDEDNNIAAQIYAVDATTSGHNLGAKLDVTVDGMYYTTGAASGDRPSKRHETKNEIAVKGDITEAVKNKADLPGECPPWLNPTGETPYPWFMASLDVESAGLGPDAEGNLKANVGAYNFNSKQYYKWEKNLPFAATQSKAGLMTAADKVKVDSLATIATTGNVNDLVQTSGDVLILNCNF